MSEADIKKIDDIMQTATNGARLQRIAFFGRLEEKKGLTLFAEALNGLQPQLLEGIELEFVGRPTPT